MPRDRTQRGHHLEEADDELVRSASTSGYAHVADAYDVVTPT
jgi:hypothetical protein